MSFLLEIVWYSKCYKDLPRLRKTAAGLSSAEHILQVQGKVTLFNKMPALCFLTVTLIWTFIYLFIVFWFLWGMCHCQSQNESVGWPWVPAGQRAQNDTTAGQLVDGMQFIFFSLVSLFSGMGSLCVNVFLSPCQICGQLQLHIYWQINIFSWHQPYVYFVQICNILFAASVYF